MADVEIHAETLNLTLQVGPGAADMAELKGLIMSQSSQIAEVRTLVIDAFEDFDARVDRLQAGRREQPQRGGSGRADRDQGRRIHPAHPRRVAPDRRERRWRAGRA